MSTFLISLGALIDISDAIYAAAVGDSAIMSSSSMLASALRPD